jgi:hypothetical protein
MMFVTCSNVGLDEAVRKRGVIDVAPEGPTATTMGGSPVGQTTTMMSRSAVGPTTTMMSESSPHVQEEVDSQGVVVLAVVAVDCIAPLCICCAGYNIVWIAWSGLIFNSIGLVAQIISLAQGKQYD